MMKKNMAVTVIFRFEIFRLMTSVSAATSCENKRSTILIYRCTDKNIQRKKQHVTQDSNTCECDLKTLARCTYNDIQGNIILSAVNLVKR
jgi:hypothetical protein